ncbi:SDR family oxidoreductase [Ramlibacter sp. USB13]|uniref:SDR family oxidoreductase n=1 Tax=Ramlibacter cellulosilyticus TaxID=2764187 RepID=A0A923MTD7_9BURK|nr:SDR family oxidoreductase [Ramlibacter cellulosilyticus]MBC5784898.1 SDR family oxidoreductase [Ramlibacter cellulosilyticus]
MRAKDARVLLTGATGGIGKAAARALRAAGARVMLSARSPEALVDQANALRSGGDIPTWAAADLCNPQQVQQLAAEAASWRCNVVVHAAGVPAFGPLAGETPEHIASVVQANLVAPMLLTRALLPHLQRLPAAQVIYVGSVLGALALPGFSVYSATKFGLRGFAEGLRRELAHTGVLVQYLGPRSTRTAFNNADVEAYNRATGTAMDDVDIVGAALVRLLEEEQAERFLGFPERLGVRLNGIAPAAMDGSFRRHGKSLADLPSLQERTEP